MVRVNASSSTVSSADNAAFRATASRVGKHGVPRVRTSPVPASPPCDAAEGLDVSLRYILENLILQRQLRHHSLEFRVLPLQFFLSFRLIQLRGALFLLPAVVRPHGDFNFLRGLRGGLSVRDSPFDPSQQRHDLFCFVPLDGYDQPSSS